MKTTIGLFKEIEPIGAWSLVFGLLALPALGLDQAKKEPAPLVMSRPFKLSGFTQFIYTGWEKGIDGFSGRRVRFTLGGDLFKNVNYKLQVDALKSPILIDALVEFKFSSALGLRVGQFKVPFSQENLTSGADLDTINRSIPEEKLCPGRDISAQGRDIGAALFGTWSVLEYTLGVFNGSGINRGDLNSQKDIGARILVRPLDFLSLGAAHYEGRTSAAVGARALNRDRTGLELALLKGPISLKGEHIFAKDEKLERDGWYLQGGYFITPRKLQAIVKFDSYDKDLNAKDDRTSLLTLGVNWFLAGRSKLQVNYELYKLESGKTDNSAILVHLQAGF